jgi:RNA polymerase sigma factor (sigma-70 family)
MPQQEDQIWFDLNLAVMEDEALVVLAKECEYAAARDELIVRYTSQTERLIGWLGHSNGMSRSDAEDARQSAVFWTIEAITKYDTNQIGKTGGCSFRSFVYRVLISRFKDFAKHLRRVECHYDRTARSGSDDPSAIDMDRKLKDPASIAEAQESIRRLQRTLTSLDEESARLWQLLADGNNLRQIATQLGMSYDAAKRRRRKLLDHLKLRLNSAQEPANATVGGGG